MRRKKIALILPIRFAVRAFLESEAWPILRKQADLLIISPFANNEGFRRRYAGEGIHHALLLEFQATDKHLFWSRLLQKAVKKKWNLESHRVIDELLAYHGGHKQINGSTSMIWKLLRTLFYSPWFGTSAQGLNVLRGLERASFDREYNDSYYYDLFQREKPDLVVSASPNRRQELPLARVAKSLRIPHIVYILSFDNICCYDEYPVVYDHYMVWNERNHQELLHQYPSVSAQQVSICGPIQFDFYFQREKYLMSRARWAEMVGIRDDRPILLYAETGHNVAPHEPAIVADLAERIRSHNMQSEISMLVRTHPMYPLERWNAVRNKYPELVFSCTNTPRGQSTTLNYEDHVDWHDQDLTLLINTLHHSDVHWNVSSTMTLDAAYFDRPVVCIAYDPRPGGPFSTICRRLYDRDHYVDITRSGGAIIARTPEEAWQATLAYLENPKLHQEERRAMLAQYDEFMDGQAARRVANRILSHLHSSSKSKTSKRKASVLSEDLLPL